MWRYHLLLTDMTPAQIEELKQAVTSGSKRPIDVKKALARRIVADFHSADAAAQAQKDFETQFQEKALPEVIDLLSAYPLDKPIKIFRLLTDLKLCESNSEAQRKIKEGSVSIAVGDLGVPDWKRVSDPTWEFDPKQQPMAVFRVGRRVLQVSFRTQ